MNELENRLKQLSGVTDFAVKDIAKELESMIRKQIIREINVEAILNAFKKMPHGEVSSNYLDYWDKLELTFHERIMPVIKAIEKGEEV